MSYLARQAVFPVFWAALFAFFRFPYWSIVVLAAWFAAFYFWQNKAALSESRRLAFADGNAPAAYIAFVSVLLWIAIGVRAFSPCKRRSTLR
jgi:hypothetical protein